MIIYENTFDNIKTIDCDFPIEDKYYAINNLAVVADGITRDPIGIDDLSKVSFEEIKKKYPRPSGAELAALEIVNCFKEFNGDLKEQLKLANQKILKLNKNNIKKCDYLQNDYYGAVASCAFIDNNHLYYAYICDCGVIIYDKNGKIKFQTQDDKEVISDPYINKIGIPWHLPEARIIVRRDYRNNSNNIQNGKCISYGALTGEESANEFIKEGFVPICDDDIIVVYTDGFTHYLHEPEFIKLIIKFQKSEFEDYVEKQANINYEKYGKERTLVIMKQS